MHNSLLKTSNDPNQSLYPKDKDSFYLDLITRNRHFISPEIQAEIQKLKVLVAGCGAAGGACIEPLARLGVTHFKLADNGSYELSNLNRQHTFIDYIGFNKASFHKQEILRINPFIDVEAFPNGIHESNIFNLIQWADIVIDAVDVTTEDAIQLKFLLHEVAYNNKKPVLSPLDPGFCQCGIGWDYRQKSALPLHGKLDLAKKTKNPIKALFTMFPLSFMPDHSMQLFVDLLENPQLPASQLGASADVLGGVIVAAITRFASTGELIPNWYINLDQFAYTKEARIKTSINAFFLRRKANKLMKNLR